MKLLSVAIPSYNSQDYMANCIESLLPGGEDVEIIIVNDGSKDNTAKIADEYAEKYPTIVKAVHQENGGHGEAVNAGLANATGLYFRVVDSDDWVNREAYMELLEGIRKNIRGSETVDMFISNYVYEKEGAEKKRVMRYPACFPEGEVFGWDQFKKLSKSHYLLMHALTYRTELLKDCGLKLPAHTFYVDNLYAFIPLPYVKKMYYLDVNFYRYYIGREDQSVNEKIMIGRIDQQLKVNRLMIDYMAGKKLDNKNMRKYMLHYLSIIMTVSSVLLLRSGTEENLEKKEQLWQYLKGKDRRLHRQLRHSIMGQVTNLPGRGGRKLTVMGYKIAQRIYGFN